jgi:hypothetical protein
MARGNSLAGIPPEQLDSGSHNGTATVVVALSYPNSTETTKGSDSTSINMLTDGRKGQRRPVASLEVLRSLPADAVRAPPDTGDDDAPPTVTATGWDGGATSPPLVFSPLTLLKAILTPKIMLLVVVGIFGQFNNYMVAISVAVHIALQTPNTTVIVPKCVNMLENVRCLEDVFDWSVTVREFPLQLVSSAAHESLNCNDSLFVQCHDASRLFGAFWKGNKRVDNFFHSLRPPLIVTLLLQANSLLRFPYLAIHSRNLDGRCFEFVRKFLGRISHARGNVSCELPIHLIQKWRTSVDALFTPLVVVSDNQRPEHDARLTQMGAINANALFDEACTRNSSMRLSLDFWCLVRSTHFLSAPMSTLSGNVCRVREALNLTHCHSMLEYAE